MSPPEEVVLGGMAAGAACMLRKMMVEDFSDFLLLLDRRCSQVEGDKSLCVESYYCGWMGGRVFVCAASCKQRFIFA